MSGFLYKPKFVLVISQNLEKKKKKNHITVTVYNVMSIRNMKNSHLISFNSVMAICNVNSSRTITV